MTVSCQGKKTKSRRLREGQRQRSDRCQDDGRGDGVELTVSATRGSAAIIYRRRTINITRRQRDDQTSGPIARCDISIRERTRLIVFSRHRPSTNVHKDAAVQ